MMGNISFKTNFWHSLIFLLLIFSLYGCEDSGRSLDELASGPKFDPQITGIGEELSENRRQNLVDTLPRNLVPLDGEAGILYVNGNPLSTEVVLSDSPIPIEWTTSIDGGLLRIFMKLS